MEYKIEDIGASFSDKEIKSLEQIFTARSGQGYDFHSIISVEHRAGCFGMEKNTTHLAVYVKHSD